MQELRKLLSDTRNSYSLSQEEMVEYLRRDGIKVSMRSYGNYERGTSEPPPTKAAAMRDAIHRLPAYIARNADEYSSLFVREDQENYSAPPRGRVNPEEYFEPVMLEIAGPDGAVVGIQISARAVQLGDPISLSTRITGGSRR